MMSKSDGNVTVLLERVTKGDRASLDELIPIIYKELRSLAGTYLRGEFVGHTLQPTALVHEVYLRLVDQQTRWESRSYFFQVAAQMMRRILIDHARKRMRVKRGGLQQRVSLEDLSLFAEGGSTSLLILNESVDKLASMDPRQAQVVELRFFGGLTVEETAKVLKVSPKTVKREWSVAKAWLYGDLKDHGVDTGAVDRD